MTFKPDPQIQVIEIPAEFAPYENDEPLRVSIRTNLTLAEVHRVDQEKPLDLASIFELYAPFVVGWTIDVPPPAEEGAKQFYQLPHLAARIVVVEMIRLLRLEAVRVLAVSDQYGTETQEAAQTLANEAARMGPLPKSTAC